MSNITGKTFRRVLAITIAAPVILLGSCALVLSLITAHLLKVVQLDRHSIEVLATSHELQKLLIDMETGTRGYLMTEDKRFLEPYEAARPQVIPKLWELSKLVSDNTTQTAALNDIKASVWRWRELAEKSIQTGRTNDATSFLNTAISGKAMMDSIRSQITNFDQSEERLLAERSRRVTDAQRLFFMAGLISLGSLILGISLHVWRQMQKLATAFASSLTEVANQKESFRVTLSSIGDAVVVTDVDGQVTFMNAEAEKLTGWSWDEAKGKALRSIFKIVNEETRRPVDDPVEKVFREKRVIGLANHTLLLSKDGAEWPIEDSAAPIYNPDKSMVGVVLVFHDATEMRRASQILKTHADDLEVKVLERTMELQRTINELEAFSYTVSHDLRAPLRAMQGYSNVLLHEYSDKWGEEERQMLERISRASERLDVLIQDILTYSKIQKDHQAIKPVNLDSLITDILTQYPTFQNPMLQMEISRPLGVVLGHESGLTQVISNLLTNAIKFVDPNRPPKIRIRTESNEFTVKLWVEDNGIGIDPRNHARIFRMFEQVDAKRFEGTGIGLAIVKKAVEAMQGTVGLESEVGKGTRMWIELLKAR